MLDLALALNALIWFSVMILPVYGFITGFKDRQQLMMRASVLVVSLSVILLALEMILAATPNLPATEDLTLLHGYRPWLLFGVSGGLALGWALFVIGKSLRARS